jgi:DNA-binding CsgD family transcriptional regulator
VTCKIKDMGVQKVGVINRTEELTNREREQQLHISTETVKTHLKNIYRKLQASGKVDALNKFRSS